MKSDHISFISSPYHVVHHHLILLLLCAAFIFSSFSREHLSNKGQIDRDKGVVDPSAGPSCSIHFLKGFYWWIRLKEKTKVNMAYLHYGRNTVRQIVKETSRKSLDGAIHPLLYACQGVRYRKLEVILTTNIEKLGKAGETVKVAPGYFRNHLMPKLLAVPNINKFAHLIREQRKIYQHEEEEEVKVVKETKEDKMKQYEMAAKRLDKGLLAIRAGVNAEKFRARAANDAPIEILSPVTKEDIVNEVARQLNVQIEPENLYLPSPLTTLGEFQVPLRLPKSIPLPDGKVSWTLKVKIRGK